MCEHLCEYLCGHLCRCVRQMVLQASTTAQLIRPSMSPLSLPTLNPGATSSIVIADLVNADGAVDVVIASSNGTSTTLYVNDGNGTLRAVAAFPSSYALAFVDVNGDGSLDLPAALALSPLPGVAMVRAWSSLRVALFEPLMVPKSSCHRLQCSHVAFAAPPPFTRRRVHTVFVPGAWW